MAHTTLLNYDALAFQLPSSAAPAVDVVSNRPFLAFDDTTPQTAYTRPIAMPGQYAAGTLTAHVGYSMASATSGTLQFEIAVEAVTDADAFDLDTGDSFDTVNDTGAETVPGTAGYLGLAVATLTNKDSVAAGDLVRFSLSRDADDATNDTATGNCRVYFLEIWETT